MAVEALAEIPGVNMQELRLQGFRIHELSPINNGLLPATGGRRDFYKMGLVTGDMKV